MILRIFRASVVPGQEDRLAHFVRDEAAVESLGISGLLSFQPGVREVDGRLELVLVSTWTEFSALLSRGNDLSVPIAMPGAGRMVEDGRADHFELVVGGARGIPLRNARLRIVTGRLKQHAEAAYFERARAMVDPLLDDRSLVAIQLGRRVAGSCAEAVKVSVWSEDAALDQAIGTKAEAPLGGDETLALYDGAPTVERFDALTVAEESADAPAILLADDDRRYLHATPAAAELTGRSVARLLTMRVDDLTPAPLRERVPELWSRFLADGALAGPYELERPDGATIEVTYTARARSPWPGCHASLLTPGVAMRASEDVDRALTEAGFVARYATAI